MKTFTRIILFTGVFTFYCGMLKAQQVTDSLKSTVSVDSTIIIDSTNKVDTTVAIDSLSSDTSHEVSSDALHKVEDVTKAADSLKEDIKKSYFMVGLSYLNNNVYLGRKDSTVLPYLTFNAGYYFKSGFFIDGSINYLASSAANRIDAVDFDGGYSFTANNYSGQATVSKYFYSSQSTNVKSNVTTSVSYFNSYDLGFITPTFTAALNFGTKTDVAGTLGMEHTFFAMDDNLAITPAFTVNASTQNYYNNYYKTRRYTIKRKNKTPQTGVAKITGVVENASDFKILDYEISLPIDYTTGKFSFNINPVYALPINPSKVQITTTKANNVSTTRVTTEKIENNFFITVGATYKFGK
jgi:hypothetical protein